MKDKIIEIMHKKYFHLCMMIIIIATILFALGITVLKYSVEGETNMPFSLTKIAVVSSSGGLDNNKAEEVQSKWSFNVYQNNDIYIYLEKNPNYQKEEIIDKIIIDNIKVEKLGTKGVVNFYKPEAEAQNILFKNSENNKIEKIEFLGDMQSNVKQLKIANQGGVVAFRYANDNLAEYKSDEEVINHNELLKKANISEDDLKAKLKFILTISLKSGKEYKANVSIDTPIEGIIEKGTTHLEKTDLKDIVFKRTKN